MSVLIGHAKANRALAHGFRLEAARADVEGHSRTAYQLRRMASAYDTAAVQLEEQMRAEASTRSDVGDMGQGSREASFGGDA
jgi:hypothetical protein